MKPRLYLETTIPSYLTSRPSRDLIIAGHQQITREWWDKRRGNFSDFLPLLDIAPEVNVLASARLASGKVPRKAASDAAHIAIATVHGMDFLVTWNCVHIANAATARGLASICREHGYECPTICTPEELLEE